MLAQGRHLCWPSLRWNKGEEVGQTARTESFFVLSNRAASASSNTKSAVRLSLQVWMHELTWVKEGFTMIKSEALNIVYVFFWIQDLLGIDQQGCEHTGASKPANVCAYTTVPRPNRRKTIQTDKTRQKNPSMELNITRANSKTDSWSKLIPQNNFSLVRTFHRNVAKNCISVEYMSAKGEWKNS